MLWAMAPTMYAKLWRDQVDQGIANDPDYARRLHETIGLVNSGEMDWLADTVAQPHGQPRRGWYEVAAIDAVALYLQHGHIVVHFLDVGMSPKSDRSRTANDAALSGLPEPWEARFWGGAGDDDGYLAWTRPVDIAHRLVTNKTIVARFQPAQIPLEAGSTQPETTMWHLTRSGGVARWPYGSNQIVALLATTEAVSPRRPLGAPDFIEGAVIPLATAEPMLDP